MYKYKYINVLTTTIVYASIVNTENYLYAQPVINLFKK